MKKKKNLFYRAILLYSIFLISNTFGQIYEADFTNNDDGFLDHTTASPPASAPVNVGAFGSLPNQWNLSYTSDLSSDATANSFKVVSGALVSNDWGGQGIFMSQSIDISEVSSINISAISENIGANDNDFTYFYILDNGDKVETTIGETNNGDAVNYNISNLDVFVNTSLIVGFEFSENGSNSGYSTSSFTVTEATTNPTIGFNNATSEQTEDIATFNVSIPITVNNYDGNQIDVSITASGTANATDYTLNTNSLSFTANGTQNLSIDINSDLDLNSENVVLTITETSTVTDLTIPQATHTLTIIDNEIATNFTEDFSNSDIVSSYNDGSFIGNNNITWHYTEARNEANDNNEAGIDGKAIMLRDLASNSKIISSTISGGIGNFSVKLYKGYTGAGNRQVALFINGISKGTSISFDDDDDKDTYTFTVENINITGDFTLEIKNIKNTQVILDDISWTNYTSDDPTIGFNTATSNQTETNATFNVSIPVTTSNYNENQIDISISTSGTADNSDYSLNTNTISFTENGTQYVSLDINPDDDKNPTETIILTLTETSAVTGLIISQENHTITITDDDALEIPSLIISEIADPKDEIEARFVEIYNNGDYSIDLAAQNIYFVKSVNSTLYQTPLTGILQPNTVFTIANSTNFNTHYGFSPDKSYNNANGNGDDAYYLYYGGDKDTGIVLDAYGELGTSGSGENWEYTDAKAVRLNPKTINPSDTWTASEWSIIENTNLIDMTPGALENEFRYDGIWKPKDVYANVTLDDDVYITENVTLINNITANNFNVLSEKIATITSGKSLIVHGTSTGNITYNRNLTSNWHLVSSPVSGETIANMRANNSFLTNASNKISFAPYDNTQADVNNRWTYFANTATSTLINGKGYSTKLAEPGTISFTGVLNTDDVSIALTQGHNNYNFLGNPYTAFINSGTFLASNTNELVQEEIYIWNENTEQYDTKVSGISFKIAPGQGFFVEANTTNTVTIAKEIQSTETTDTFQKSNANPKINLKITDQTTTRNSTIYYINGTSTGFDNGYDGKIFGGVPQSFALYTHLVSNSNGQKYQVQSLPNSNYDNMIIPIGINAKAKKEIIFFAETQNFPSEIKVYLEDKLTNTFTRLDKENSTYKITLNKDLNGIGRFYLYTTQKTLNIDNNLPLNNISIYKTTNSNLKVTGLSNGNATIKIVNLLGKHVLHTTFTSTHINNIKLPKLTPGIYFVDLKTDRIKLNKKIILE